MPTKHKNPKNRILMTLLPAFNDRPLTLMEHIIGTRNCIEVAFNPPVIPMMLDKLGKTIETKQVNVMNIAVHTMFSFIEKVSRPKKRLKTWLRNAL